MYNFSNPSTNGQSNTSHIARDSETNEAIRDWLAAEEKKLTLRQTDEGDPPLTFKQKLRLIFYGVGEQACKDVSGFCRFYS